MPFPFPYNNAISSKMGAVPPVSAGGGHQNPKPPPRRYENGVPSGGASESGMAYHSLISNQWQGDIYMEIFVEGVEARERVSKPLEHENRSGDSTT